MGRYCWSCGRSRPNERFSRKSGRRGVCRECYGLGEVELAYRQAVRNIDRALRHSSTIPRRHRAVIESLAKHSNPRIREYASEVISRDREERAEFLQLIREDEAQLEVMLVEIPADVNPYALVEIDDAEDIPF